MAPIAAGPGAVEEGAGPRVFAADLVEARPRRGRTSRKEGVEGDGGGEQPARRSPPAA